MPARTATRGRTPPATFSSCESPDLPNLAALGLLRVATGTGGAVQGAFGRMREVSAGKDSTTGHWEMMGLATARPFPVYPNGFPGDVIEAVERAIGRKVLGNRPASGTRILEDLGAEHLATGRPIVYTSGDSVFQIAAHETVISAEALWEMCRRARRVLAPPHAVGRVIARPFLGEPGKFVRTANRRDFSLEPPGPTFLDRAAGAGLKVHGIGKISDIFAGRGLSSREYSVSDEDGIEKTVARLRESDDDFVFTNLVDFDSKYGHRNDVEGFARNLRRLDAKIPELLACLRPADLFFLTADHGCDPSDASTDHTRELVPLLVAGPCVRPGADLGVRETFRDLAATLEVWFGIEPGGGGRSALSEILS